MTNTNNTPNDPNDTPNNPNTTHLLDHGFIRLDAHHANDIDVVNAARVSYGKHTTTLTHADKQLIGYLLKNKHGTPFEHTFYRFHIKAPIFIAREWMRHRIGWSYNEQSARYTQLPNQTYTPQPQHLRTQTGKPGHYQHQPHPNPQPHTHTIQQHNNHAHQTYQQLINQGISKEQARLILPVSTYTQFYATTNARALMNFITLRSHPTAQWEIQQYANTLEQHLKNTMPTTHHHYTQNNKQAP